MNRKSKIMKAILFDVILLGVDCVSLYTMMFGKDNSSLLTAFLATVLFISVPLFVYFNYSAFSAGPKPLEDEQAVNVNDLDTTAEFAEAFAPYKGDKILDRYAETAVRQLYSMDKKTSTIEQVLMQNFSQGLSEFDVVNQVVSDSRCAVYSNMREIFNRMTIFEGVTSYHSGNVSGTIMAEKQRMMNEHIDFIVSVLNNNEIIFLELDKLMVEITEMSRTDTDPDREIQKIQDIVSSLKRLHNADSSEYNRIAEAYDQVQVPELYEAGNPCMGGIEHEQE